MHSPEQIEAPLSEPTSSAQAPAKPRIEARFFPSIQNTQRNQLIDLLRGLSILMVVLSHLPALASLWEQSSVKVYGRTPYHITTGMGFYGVAVFFVISGFLITKVTLQRSSPLSRIDCSGFWWMRFSRIMPMLLACLFGMAVFHFIPLPRFHFSEDSMLWKNMSGALSFRFNELLNVHPAQTAWNPMWSLSVEELFYLAFPFVCLAINGFGAALWICITLIATSLYMRYATQASPYTFLGSMDLLALGCLLALCRPEKLKERLSRAATTITGLVCFLGGIGLIVHCVFRRFPFDTEWAALLCGLGATVSLLGTQLLPLPGRWLRLILMPLSAIGVISYELYLIHMPLAVLLSSVLGQDSWLLVGLAIFAALLTHECFSEPMNKLLRRMGLPSAEGSRKTAPQQDRRWLSLLGLCSLAATVILLGGWLGHSITRPSSSKFKIMSIAKLPPGSNEPLAYVGVRGSADLIYLKHEANGLVRFAVDHWGLGGIESAALDPDSLTKGIFEVHFGPASVSITQNGKTLVENPVPPHRSAPSKLGTNDIGFSTTPASTTSVLLPCP